jgi:hypothetical protein
MNAIKPVVGVFLLVVAALLSIAAHLFKPAAPYIARALEPFALLIEGMCVTYLTENIKSTVITNADATPVDMSAAYLSHGRLREAVGVVEAAGGDAGSTYRFVRVWSGWRISELIFASDDLTGTGVMDVGVYQTAENGGAVVDIDLFASDIDVSGAAVAETSILRESTEINIDESEKRLWELLGLTEDPKRWYDIVGTSGTAAVTGTMMLKCRYVDGT